MIQLTYNEAFDPYHAAFRFIRLWKGCQLSGKTHFDLLRILDFYLLFPFRLQNMTLVASDLNWRRISKNYENRMPYGGFPDDISIFTNMEPFQRAAVNSLVKADILSSAAWHNNQIEFLEASVPSQLETRCAELNASMDDIVQILRELRNRYPLLGQNGLKDRTGLMEFRYDSV